MNDIQSKLYNYSEDAINNRKKLFWTIRLFIPIALLGFMLSNSSLESSGIAAKLVVYVISLIMIEVILFIQPPLIFKKLRELEIKITDNVIERKGRKSVETIKFQDIDRLIVNANTFHEITFIKLYSMSKKINIGGFEDMNSLFEEIEARISDKSIIQRKNASINWENPCIVLSVMSMGVLIIIGFQMIGKLFYEIVNALFITIVGAFILSYRPISRNSGDRFKRFETICGAILVILSPLMLIGFLIIELLDR